jgi:hypothetical protein
MAVESGTAVVTEAPVVTQATPVATIARGPDYTAAGSHARTGPIGGGQLVRRVIILVFGLIQLVIALRFVLVLLDARTANALVSAVMNISQIFVAPFNGILNTDALASSGSTIDVAAIVAFIGWTILEVVILWAVGIFRREPA